jgi:hypothetical protein
MIDDVNTVDLIKNELATEDPLPQEDLNMVSIENIYIDENKQISINFIDGYKKYNDNRIGFGPLVNNDGPSPISGAAQSHQFQLDIKNYKSAVAIIDEYRDRAMVIKPNLVKIGEFEVVKYAQGGLCEERIMEVVGRKYNYQFSTSGCHDSQNNDFNYLSKAISQMKIIGGEPVQSLGNLKADQAYYVSEKLGIKFIYATIDPLYGVQKCLISEIGNKITNSCGYSLLVLNKNSNVSPATVIDSLIQDKQGDCGIALLDGFNNFDIGFRIKAPADNPDACGRYSSHYMGEQHNIYFSFNNRDRYLIINYGGHEPKGGLEAYPNGFKFWYETVEIF